MHACRTWLRIRVVQRSRTPLKVLQCKRERLHDVLGSSALELMGRMYRNLMAVSYFLSWVFLAFQNVKNGGPACHSLTTPLAAKLSSWATAETSSMSAYATSLPPMQVDTGMNTQTYCTMTVRPSPLTFEEFNAIKQKTFTKWFGYGKLDISEMWLRLVANRWITSNTKFV